MTGLRGKLILLRLECMGHGGAKEGEQEIVQDRFEEEQDRCQIEPVSQTQSCRRFFRRAAVAIRSQEQSCARREGEVRQE